MSSTLRKRANGRLDAQDRDEGRNGTNGTVESRKEDGKLSVSDLKPSIGDLSWVSKDLIYDLEKVLKILRRWD